jgi:hypothetical protein
VLVRRARYIDRERLSMSDDVDSTTEERTEKRYRTKAERQQETHDRINASLPSVDMGQFAGVTSKLVDVFTESQRALKVAERMVYGASMKDACMIEGAKYHSYREALRGYRNAERPAEDRSAGTDLHREGTWSYVLGFTIDRALSLCRVRWQLLAEAGGKGSKSAMWMLERRGGREYLPPVRREQVTSTNTTTNTTTTLTLEAKLEATRSALGFSDEHLAQMGEWLSRAQTSAQRGEPLPPPPQQPQLPAPAEPMPFPVTKKEEPKRVIDIELKEP